MMQLMRLADGAATALIERTDLPARLRLRFGDITVDVHASSQRALQHLKRVYAYFVAPAEGTPALRLVLGEHGSNAHAAISQQLVRRRPVPGHALVASWFDWAIALDGATMLNYYASKMLRLAVVEAQAAQALTLHAASVMVGDNGVLLIGEAAAGKTSLTLRLIDSGARYGADDTTPIRRSDLQCMPFPTPFVVRPDLRDGRPTQPELRDRPPDIVLLDEPRWLVGRLDAVAPEFRPTHLFFLDGSRVVSDVLEPIAPAEAALELLRNTVVGLGATPDSTDDEEQLDLVVRLVSASSCHRLPSADLDRAHRQIHKVLA